MASFSQITLVGNVGKEPEMRYTQSGIAVCSFSIAVSKHWTDKQTNERKESTTWVKITAWRELAEIVNQYVRKGSQVLVSGSEIKASAYLDKNNQPAASLELTAQTVQVLGKREDNAAAESGTENTYQEPSSDIGEIPF